MSLDFSPPSYRAASGDLTISISPLGLVELADEIHAMSLRFTGLA